MGNHPVILAFDTALFGCSAAVMDTGTGACTAETRPMARGQAEQLVPMIEEVLGKSGQEFSDIDIIGTTIGPGAFTGLRIGLATARALGLALNRPVTGVTTLEALARQFQESNQLGPDQYLAVIIETKRKDYYFQLFDSGFKPSTPPEALEGAEIAERLNDKDVVIIGDATERFQGENPDAAAKYDDGFALIDPTIIARITAERFAGSEAQDLPKPEPLYLRPADVSKPKRKPRTLVG